MATTCPLGCPVHRCDYPSNCEDATYLRAQLSASEQAREEAKQKEQALVAAVRNYARTIASVEAELSAAEQARDARETQIRALIADLRARSAENMRWQGVPCQLECSWHAQEYAEYADRLAALLEQEPTEK